MNKTLLLHIASFVGGLVVGGLSGSLYFKKRYEKWADEEIEQMERYYKENFEIIYPEDHEDADENKEAPKEYLKKSNYVDSNSIERGKVDTKATDYTAYYKGDPADNEHPDDDLSESLIDEDYEAEYSAGEYLTRERRKSKGPKIIKAEEFGSIDGVDQTTLLYYTGDDVLADEEENVYADLEEVRGMLGDAMEKYGFKDNDESTMYVRNMSRQMEYEIIKVNGFFQDLVEKGVR